MSETGDRIVHARWAQMEVVRYDREGRWYLEPVGSDLPRQRVSLKEAVDYALRAEREQNGELLTGAPGGGRFDAIIAAAHTPGLYAS